jgi:hypothetical protein
MKLLDVVLLEGPWKRVGNHKGILTRTITPAEREAAERKQKERNKKRYAASKEGKLEELRLEKIPDLGSSEIENVFNTSGMGLGGTIEDIYDRKDIFIKVNDFKVAAQKMTLGLVVDLANDLGYDQGTIDSMYDGREQVEDSITIKIYRDPKDPKKLKVSF